MPGVGYNVEEGELEVLRITREMAQRRTLIFPYVRHVIVCGQPSKRPITYMRVFLTDVGAGRNRLGTTSEAWLAQLCWTMHQQVLRSGVGLTLNLSENTSKQLV